MKAIYQHLNHDNVKPYYNKDSQILILGSFPSNKSRQAGFYYAHKTNRFFKILARLFNEETPNTTEERKEFLKRHHIALFDVIRECDIIASSDSSIKNAIANDLTPIIKNSEIKQIFTTGKTAYNLYMRLIGDDAICLPSPSAANASTDLKALVKAYSIILDHIKD